MRNKRPVEAESLWPSETQELLLRAALCDGAQAREAFSAWKQARGFAEYADVDYLSTSLLPSVYDNFTRAEISDPWLPQMAGLHRYHWAKNAARQQSLLEVLERFHAAGLQAVVCGDFALLIGGYFNDLGDRPFLSAELILSPADAPGARRVFASLGWRAADVAPPPVAGWRSELWRAPNEQTLRVNFRWLPKPYPVVGIGRLLQHAAVVEFGGLQLRIPDATDLLLQACVCGRLVHEDIRRQFLWVADAVRVFRRGGPDLDWKRLWEESRPLCTLFPLRGALEYLRTEFDAPVPVAWLEKSRQVNIPPAELRPFYRSTRQRIGLSAAGTILTRRPWAGYVAAEQAAGHAPSAGGLLRYCTWRASLKLKKLTRFARKHAAGWLA